MTEIRNATQADLDYCRANALNRSYPDFPLVGWAKTVILNGEIIGVGGVVKYWEGVGEAWIQLTKTAEEHKIEAVRYLRKTMEMAFDELNLWRIQTTERESLPKAVKLVEHLGFKKEGLMVGYTSDGGNAWLCAIIREIKIKA